MRRLSKPFTFLVVGMLLIAGTSYFLARANAADDKYTVTAYFSKAIGLFENSDVDILGVPVGKITEVTPVGSRVKVVMELDKRYKVPADAFAQIVPISVISDRYVQLEPVYEGGPTLQDGDEIPVERTQIPAELDDVFRQLKKLLDAIEPGKPGEPGALGELIVQLNETLDDREQDLKGTLINASALTGTLADARQDLSGLLVNLDDLFGQLATRANSLGTLNRNFALVMTALAQSRSDLEGTLQNLGELTEEVGDLVRDQGDQLGRDLELASRITSAILRHRASIEESQAWLPIVAKGLVDAYHPPPVNASDVRDNAASARCEDLDQLPGPIRDILKEILQDACGENPRAAGAASLGPQPAAPKQDLKVNCDRGVRKVKRQLRRLQDIGLPGDVKEQVIAPMRKNLRSLKENCRQLGGSITDPEEVVEDLLKDLPGSELEKIRKSVEGLQAAEPLTGSASETVPVPTGDEPGVAERAGDWLGGFVRFMGLGS